MKFRVQKDKDILKIITSIADCVTGRSIKDFFEAIKGKDFFEQLKEREAITKLMKDFFDAAIGQECNRLVIFIDELDRCKPPFAVHLLERIKHFFNDDRITFVFSLNRDQLQHTIRNFYGNGMDASKYLDKFFDVNINIPEAKIENFALRLGFPKTSYIYDAVCYATIKQMNMKLREITKYIKHLKITNYDEAHEKATLRNSTHASVFFLIYFVPILTALMIVDRNQFDRFIRGEDGSALFNIVTGPEFANNAQTWLLASNE